jgi:hypothetical protein
VLPLFLNPTFNVIDTKIVPSSKIFLIGSCFSDNIGAHFKRIKLNTMSNPFGVLFDSKAIAQTINRIVHKKHFNVEELLINQDTYFHLQLHTMWNRIDPEVLIRQVNQCIDTTHDFLRQANFVFVTLGSSFVYRHLPSNQFVANCHKLPQNQFEKILLPISDIYDSLQSIDEDLHKINAQIKIIKTISPVRHIRDGVIENNKSKARLIEALHQNLSENHNQYYFPSYEILIDVLRDYRFYDTDLVHPNYLATNIVFDYIKKLMLDEVYLSDFEEFAKVHASFHHRPMLEQNENHQRFKRQMKEKCVHLQDKFPYLDFSNEIIHFSGF